MTTTRMPDVLRHLTLGLHGSGLCRTCQPTSLSAELAYHRDDPYAVVLTLLPEGRRVDWHIARELLAAGMLDIAGEGDVHIQPCPQRERADMVEVRLSSPHGAALLTAPGIVLDDFLAATYRLVPAGEELDEVDVDDALAELLDTGARCPECDRPGWVETRRGDRDYWWHADEVFPCRGRDRDGEVAA